LRSAQNAPFILAKGIAKRNELKASAGQIFV